MTIYRRLVSQAHKPLLEVLRLRCQQLEARQRLLAPYLSAEQVAAIHPEGILRLRMEQVQVLSGLCPRDLGSLGERIIRFSTEDFARMIEFDWE